jgi:hypothetical protein
MRTTRTLALSALVAVLLSGCVPAGAPTPGAPTPAAPGSPTAASAPAYPIDMDAVRAELGPVPDVPPSPAELASDRRRLADEQWANALASFPGLARPDAEFVEALDSAEQAVRVAACADAASESARNAAGTTDPAAIRVAQYVCGVQYPVATGGGISDVQTAYVYDYWTGFVLPCYDAAGYDVSGAVPTKEDFVAAWPNQGWAPWNAVADGPPLDVLDELDIPCPAVLDELA